MRAKTRGKPASLKAARAYMVGLATEVEGLIEGMPSATQAKYLSKSEPHNAVAVIDRLTAALELIVSEVEPHPGIMWLATIARAALEPDGNELVADILRERSSK